MAWGRRIVHGRITGLACLALGAACSGEVEERPRPYVPPPLEDPAIERQICDSVEESRRFGELALRVSYVMHGPCGELGWRGSNGEVYFAGADGEAREVAPSGRPLWVEGERLLYTDEGKLTLLHGGEEAWSWPLPENVDPHDPLESSFGKIPGAEAFWLASRLGGIFKADAEGVTDVAPDFRPAVIEEGTVTPYRQFDASPSGHIAYATNKGRAAIVEMATGMKQDIDHEFLPWGWRDREARKHRDAIRVGSDGSFIIIQPYWSWSHPDEAWEDRVIVVGAEFPPVHLPGTLRGMDGVSHSDLISLAPWMGSSPGVFLPYYDLGESHLLGLGEPIPLGRARPRAIRGNHLFLETEKGAAILELGTGAFHHLRKGLRIGPVTPFRWGGPVAISALVCSVEDECEEDWKVFSWTQESGSRKILGDSYPASISAFGPDGSVLVTRYSRGESGPREVRRHLLYSGEGLLIREFGMDQATYFAEGLGGEHFAIVVRTREGPGNEGQDLMAIDWATGQEQVLASGSQIVRWSLDHSDRRIMAVVRPDPESDVEDLWSGTFEF